MRWRITLALLSLLLPASLTSAATINIFATDGQDNTILSFQMIDGGVPVQTGTISTGVGGSPNKMAIVSNAELFVANGLGNNILRYVGLDSTLTPNPTYPTIADSNAADGFDFNNPNGLAFRNGELFNVNLTNNNVLRFNFDGSGAPLANLPSTSLSSIDNTRGRAIGFSPSGDRMYVTGCCSATNALAVYSVDMAGNTSLLKTLTTTNFTTAGVEVGNLQGLTVSSTGELWLADTAADPALSDILRVTLDAAGNISTASVAVPGNATDLFRPQGLYFSDNGELFVSNIGISLDLNDGFLSRFTFDGSGNILTSSRFGPAGDYSSIILYSLPTIPISASVPEPSALLLIGLGACFCLKSKRRRV
jgi:sugar lactone lactonase YvrE